MRVLTYLKRPYPFYSNSKEALWLVLAISSFIGLFCYIFQPFGLENSTIQNSALISAGFGLITLLSSLFNMVLMPKLFPKILTNTKWTVYKELLWVIWMLLCIALANWVYANLFYSQPEFDLLSFLFIAGCTIVIGLMPAIGVILFKQSQSLKNQMNEVVRKVVVAKEGVVHFISENEKEKLSIPRSQILLISSAGNYSEIFYMQGDKQEKALLRNKISNLEMTLKDFPEIIRCHRKHIINVDKILVVEGNAQGYKVRLFNMSEHIPVSRSYAKAVNEARMS